MARARILVADAQDTVRREVVRSLEVAGYEVEEVSSGIQAIALLHRKQYEVILADLELGGSDGLDLLRRAKELQPTVAVILMTRFGTVQAAVEAMQIGAFDFVPKPFDVQTMQMRVEKALEYRRLTYAIDYLRHTQPAIYSCDRIIGASGALQNVLGVVRKVAPSTTTVLLRGETGTGKELIASAIHHNSARANRNFVRVNCAALQENLLESELFGHEKGAFTGAHRQRVGRFEQADGGSLFLDEVADMSPHTQAKVLRVLQEQEFERLGATRTLSCDVRVIAATNRDLSAMVASGQFREDLFYRLNVVSIDMPPLRDRTEDIPELAEFFTERCAREIKTQVKGIEPAAVKLLTRYRWPGNIRELENAIERAVLLADGPFLRPQDLRLGDWMPPAIPGGHPRVVSLPATGVPLQEIEKQAITEALRMTSWVQKDAAELLGISPRVINYKIKVLDIQIPRRRRSSPQPSVEERNGTTERNRSAAGLS
jgi:DNA-binding NtrC family response regulator